MRIKEKRTTPNYEGKAELMTIKMPAPVKPEGVDAAVWEKMLSATPTEARHLIREGKLRRAHKRACAPGYAQANLIVLPNEQAYDFLLFAQRNPKPCPHSGSDRDRCAR